MTVRLSHRKLSRITDRVRTGRASFDGSDGSDRSDGSDQPVLIANPGADLYGSDRMVLESITALVEAGRRVVLTVPGPGPLVELAERAGAEVRLTRTPIIRKAALRPAGLVALLGDTLASIGPGLALLRRVRPSSVLVNTITPPLWLLLARLSGVPVVCHVHEGEASAPRPIRVALACPLLLADRLIVNSEFSLGVLTGAIPALGRRAVVIYNAVAGPPSMSPARAELTEPIRLLYVGRLSARKGPDVAIRALIELRRRGVEATLTVVGAVFPGYEWFADELDRLVAEAELGDRVRFVGFRADRWPDTAASDIVLVPSTVDEPFGNVAVEAGLAARPSVVSDLAGLREASSGIGSAVLVPPSDPVAVADAVLKIQRAWADFRTRAMADAAELEQRYAHRSYAERLDSVLADLIASPTNRVEAQSVVRT